MDWHRCSWQVGIWLFHCIYRSPFPKRLSPESQSPTCRMESKHAEFQSILLLQPWVLPLPLFLSLCLVFLALSIQSVKFLAPALMTWRRGVLVLGWVEWGRDWRGCQVPAYRETFKYFSVLFFPTFRGIWCLYLLTSVLECFLNITQFSSYWHAAFSSMTLIITFPSAFLLSKCWFLLSAVFLVSLFLQFFYCFSLWNMVLVWFQECVEEIHMLCLPCFSYVHFECYQNALWKECSNLYFLNLYTCIAFFKWTHLPIVCESYFFHPCQFFTKLYVP